MPTTRYRYLEDKENTSMSYVEYDSNNSGGRWWLTDQNWLDLEKAGWDVRWYRGAAEGTTGSTATGAAGSDEVQETEQGRAQAPEEGTAARHPHHVPADNRRAPAPAQGHRMKISRLNYDKPHRCPGWAGSGESHVWAKKWWRIKSTCPTGQSFAGFLYYKKGTHDRSRWWQWRFIRCPACGVVCLPWVTRRLDPTWQWATWKRRVSNWMYEFSVKDTYNTLEWWLYRLFWGLSDTVAPRDNKTEENE